MKKLALLLVVALAALSAAWEVPLITQARWVRDTAYRAIGLIGDFNQRVGVWARTEVPCPMQTEQTMVMFAFGQSNAASALIGKSKGTERVVNYFNGRCYVAEDPFLGTTGNHGTVWIPLANALAAKHDHVIIAALAFGGSSVKRWHTGNLAPLLSETLKDVHAKYRVTHFLWHQGERDNGEISAAEYAASLSAIVGTAKSFSPKAGFWVSLASRCGNDGPDADVRAGQKAVVGDGVFQGPDTDSLDADYRHDGCHFSAIGKERFAEMWLRAITPPP